MCGVTCVSPRATAPREWAAWAKCGLTGCGWGMLNGEGTRRGGVAGGRPCPGQDGICPRRTPTPLPVLHSLNLIWLSLGWYLQPPTQPQSSLHSCAHHTPPRTAQSSRLHSLHRAIPLQPRYTSAGPRFDKFGNERDPAELKRQRAAEAAEAASLMLESRLRERRPGPGALRDDGLGLGGEGGPGGLGGAGGVGPGGVGGPGAAGGAGAAGRRKHRNQGIRVIEADARRLYAATVRVVAGCGKSGEQSGEGAQEQTRAGCR